MNCSECGEVLTNMTTRMLFRIKYPTNEIHTIDFKHLRCSSPRPSHGVGAIDVRALSAANMLAYRLRCVGDDDAQLELDRAETLLMVTDAQARAGN